MATTRKMTEKATDIKTPDIRAEIGAGACEWASGSQLWKGTRPAFAPKPKIISPTASRMAEWSRSR